MKNLPSGFEGIRYKFRIKRYIRERIAVLDSA